MIEIENLTFKQCINIIAVMNLLLKENVINFNPDEAVATLNYDEAMRYLENQNVEQNKEIERLNNIINEYENMKKELLDYIYHNEYCRFGHIDGGEADEMRNILKRTDKLKELKESEK